MYCIIVLLILSKSSEVCSWIPQSEVGCNLVFEAALCSNFHGICRFQEFFATDNILGKVIQMYQLDATMIFWSIRSAQHVSGNILPIIRSVRLRFLQHMCWAGRRWAAAWHIVQRCRSPSTYPPKQQDTICCKYLSLTLLMMVHAAAHRLPTHQNNRIPYAVNISVSRFWWWAKYCPKHVELIL